MAQCWCGYSRTVAAVTYTAVNGEQRSESSPGDLTENWSVSVNREKSYRGEKHRISGGDETMREKTSAINHSCRVW